ncbi:DNA-binding transcriptional regulator, GntR family [Rubritalea squalenifaciens DSM 18772]|uniref:DNA-binding transcriptional regulator, GntR family n=1 Tax=Rubritalea squalenifaciens DSM 18772 TaxID=1123071 RepID=A0A1M6PNK6_9BACT|nr:GntR family transcriptional regulator [Rubritalea squalenifaciens]SHK09526.1 DNA-binding transcriptional regulator, GntR family [Rubritalea squalenifaciens DSM 18772]
MMKKLDFHKATLGDQVTKSLKKLIKQGKWPDGLPGIHTLAEELGVSRRPVEDALKNLEAEGWLTKAERGKRRKIISKVAHKRQSHIIIFTPPIEIHNNLDKAVMRMVENYLRSQNVLITHIQVSPGSDWTKRRLIDAIPEDVDFTGIITHYVQIAFIRQHLSASLPILDFGLLATEDPLVSHIYYAQSDVIESVFRGALRKGIETPCLLNWTFRKPLREKLSKRLKVIFAEEGKKFNPKVHFPELSSKDLDEQLQYHLINHKPSIIFTIQAQFWARVISHPFVRRSGIPVFTLIDDPVFTEFPHSPAAIILNMEDFRDAAREWLNDIQAGEWPSFSRPVSYKLALSQHD